MKNFLKKHWLPCLILLVVTLVIAKEFFNTDKIKKAITEVKAAPDYWVAPSLLSDKVLDDSQRHLIEYGQSLIANTSKYMGPAGTLGHTTNGMNCQNCHLDAGTRPWGNNYSAVAATYPKFRERSGTV